MTHTILIVEDNSNIRHFIATALTLENYRVLEAANIQDGLALTRRDRPDLVLLDLALPDGSGWDFLQVAQTQIEPPVPPIAILTASADRNTADRGLSAGAIAFLTKPIAARELVAFVRQTLGGDRTQPIRSE
jgi:two-component system KDP operon response regulator KdpE